MPLPRPAISCHRSALYTPFTGFSRTARSVYSPPPSSHARLSALGPCSTTSMRLYSQQTQGQGRYIR
jgi:hypothetical protein